MAVGPSHTALIARRSPTAKKVRSPAAVRRSQAFAITSGPIPEGSPMETAMGFMRGTSSSIFDDRVPPKIAQIAACAAVYAIFLDLRIDLVE